MIGVGNIWQYSCYHVTSSFSVFVFLFLGERVMENLGEVDTFPPKAHGLLSNCGVKRQTESTTRCCSVLEETLLFGISLSTKNG